ncbi:DNA repair exonuclease [Testicularia cyperi]|uniref:DNA repair exonuclease n=1 Tax=Testicularia cyperi TaxID=1882483 RepID=A0A317XI22_9BASI|nr:DNA repair exonuclease [Testicularia cyperi]
MAGDDDSREQQQQQHDEVDQLETEGGDELPSPSFAAQNEANHLKIMLATDNHIGYMERDPVRGQDSINTFEEILQLAVQHDVDMILLGGDLFHENKPSRSSLHQTMALLRQYTLGDKPISVELLSDPNDGALPGRDFPAVNYEDPNLNVGIPVFSIHGNHDDPQGTGETGALSALDLLSVSGLINYFGKVELPSDDSAATTGSSRTASGGAFQEKGIRIKPVLLQKGDTKLALYGMGNIKDERMHFELRANRVRMYRPEEDPDSWFNILCVHQNRVAHNPKACVPETMFDDSIHLVVWGHEHEQRIQPQAVTEKRYHITQPGSSVATSLSHGETVEKCVAIIHIEQTDFLIEPIPLQTVRPFVMDDMNLADELEDAGLSSERGDIMKLLRRRVTGLIDKARLEFEEKSPGREMPLPLVRLRVEYTNQEISNPQRFGQEFAGKVANPKDVLQFSKRKSTRNGRQNGEGASGSAYVDLESVDLLPMERLEKVDVGKLVQEYLQAQNLDILNPEGLEGAVLNFVEKDDKDAIEGFVTRMLRHTVKGLVTIDPDESRIDGELERLRKELQRRGEDMDTDATATATATAGGGGASRRGEAGAGLSSRRRGDYNSDDSMMDELADETSRRAVGGRRNESDIDEQDDNSELDVPPARSTRAPARRTAVPAVRSSTTTTLASGSRARGGTGTGTGTRGNTGTFAGAASRTPRRTAAARANQTFLGQDDDDDDDEIEEPQRAARADEDDVDFAEPTPAPARAPAPASSGGGGGRHAAALSMFSKPAAGSKTTAAARRGRGRGAGATATSASTSSSTLGGSGSGRGARGAAAPGGSGSTARGRNRNTSSFATREPESIQISDDDDDDDDDDNEDQDEGDIEAEFAGPASRSRASRATRSARR